MQEVSGEGEQVASAAVGAAVFEVGGGAPVDPRAAWRVVDDERWALLLGELGEDVAETARDRVEVAEVYDGVARIRIPGVLGEARAPLGWLERVPPEAVECEVVRPETTGRAPGRTREDLMKRAVQGMITLGASVEQIRRGGG